MDPITTNYNYWQYMYFPILLNTLQTQPIWQTQGASSPWLNPLYFSPGLDVNEYANQMVEFQNALEEFQTASENLMGVFSSRSLQISGEGLTGTVQENAPIGNYQINVLQLAQAQQNTGNWLNATESSFQTGENVFSITTAQGTYTFTVNVEESMNNLQVLEEMAAQINETGIGIQAEVEVQGNQARLVLTGQMGEENAFNIQDITGNLVQTSGIQNVTQAAQNLVYEFNGVRMENETNEINMIQGVNLEASQTGEYTVTVNYNAQEIQQAAENFVNTFNQVYSYAQNLAQNSPAIQASLNVIANNPMLQGIGIELGENGLQITERFSANLENPEIVQNLVMPALTSAATSGQTLASTISNLPSYQILQGMNYNFMPNYYTYSLNPYYAQRLLSLNIMMSYLSIYNPYTYA